MMARRFGKQHPISASNDLSKDPNGPKIFRRADDIYKSETEGVDFENVYHKYRALSEEEKNKYEELERQERERYDEELKNYKPDRWYGKTGRLKRVADGHDGFLDFQRNLPLVKNHNTSKKNNNAASKKQQQKSFWCSLDANVLALIALFAAEHPRHVFRMGHVCSSWYLITKLSPDFNYAVWKPFCRSRFPHLVDKEGLFQNDYRDAFILHDHIILLSAKDLPCKTLKPEEQEDDGNRLLLTAVLEHYSTVSGRSKEYTFGVTVPSIDMHFDVPDLNDLLLSTDYDNEMNEWNQETNNFNPFRVGRPQHPRIASRIHVFCTNRKNWKTTKLLECDSFDSETNRYAEVSYYMELDNNDRNAFSNSDFEVDCFREEDRMLNLLLFYNGDSLEADDDHYHEKELCQFLLGQTKTNKRRLCSDVGSNADINAATTNENQS